MSFLLLMRYKTQHNTFSLRWLHGDYSDSRSAMIILTAQQSGTNVHFRYAHQIPPSQGTGQGILVGWRRQELLLWIHDDCRDCCCCCCCCPVVGCFLGFWMDSASSHQPQQQRCFAAPITHTNAQRNSDGSPATELLAASSLILLFVVVCWLDVTV